jgi:hypothetical protein
MASFVQTPAFDPQMTRLMGAALESAWEELKDTGHLATAPWKAQATRERLASRILEAAQSGVRDPDALRRAALASLLAASRRRPA